MAASVILFKKNKSFISKAVEVVTGCDVTHSAVLYDGDLYDASELRGDFGRAKIKKLKNRKVEVYNLGASDQIMQTWLIKHGGKKYDYSGVLQWVLFWSLGRFFKNSRLNQKKKVYCFEATANLVSKVTRLKFPENVSGCHLRRTMGKPVFSGKLDEFLENA